jgi:hypothetical protein
MTEFDLLLTVLSCSFGAATTHSLLRLHPQLLRCKVDRLMHSLTLLQQLLNVDQDAAIKIIVKAPR